MNNQELLALFDKEQRIEISYPDMRKEVTPHVVRFVRNAPGMSFILYSRLDESNAEEVIKAEVEYIKGLNQPFEWKVYAHDNPPDLAQRLADHGLELDEREAVMILDLAQAPSSLLEPVEADVRLLTGREQLADVIEVETQVWGENFDWITKRLGGHMEIPGYLSVYVAYANGDPACTGWIYFHPNSSFADLWGGSTVPEYRRRGLYTAVLAARVQEAIDRGYRFLTIDTSPMSRPIVASHSFRLLTYAQACEWPADSDI